MMPFYFNMLVSPVSYAMKQGRISTLGFGHDALGEASYLPLFKEEEGYSIAESDFSGFDTTIRPAYRKLLWSMCREYGYDEKALDLLEEFENYVTVLSAPWNTAQEGSAAVISGRLGLLSGLKITSELGSALSAAVTLKALVVSGAMTQQQVIDGNWPPFLMLGDDVLLKVKKGSLNEQAYSDACEEEGLKVKFTPGRRFLMNHIFDGVKYGVANRIIQQTAFNEDKYAHEGQIFIGMASRLSKPLFPEHWALLQSWAKKMAGIVALPEPFEILASQEQSVAISRLLNHPSVAHFLMTRAGESWLVELSQKAEITQAHATILADLLAKGFTPDLPTAYQRAELVKRLLASTADQILEGRREVFNKIHGVH